MRSGRIPTWLMLLFGVVGAMLAIPGLWVLVSVTARPLHPRPEDVPTVAHSAPASQSAAAAARARKIALAHLTEENLPGLSVAVGINGHIVWAQGFGFADLKSSVPVTPGHRFRIGTASTVLTSAAVGLLLENGRLTLDRQIQTWVPNYPDKQWPVTLRELMAHTAGVPPGDDDRGPLFTKHCAGTADSLPYFAKAPLLYKPGTQYRYSSHGWILVSAAVEAAGNQPFLAFTQQQIFDRLGMRDTGPDPATLDGDDDFPLVNLVQELIYDPRVKRDPTPNTRKVPEPNRVTPYFTRFASDPNYGLHLMRPLDYSCYAGAGAFVSTPSDLVRFGMAFNAGQLLQPATMELLRTPPRLASGGETGQGLGWYTRNVTLAGKPTRVTGQDGDSLGGMVASLMTVPEHGIVVAVTSNISHANTSGLAMKLADTFLEK